MKRLLIIGNSAAGISCAEAFRKKDKDTRVTIVSKEDYPGYNRCLISYYLAGDIKEDKLLYKPKDFYSQNNIELLLGKPASRVDAKKNQVVLEDKSRIDYDHLVLANGSSAVLPEIKGIKKNGVLAFRTIQDAKKMLELSAVTNTVSVLGGGLIGLKAAYALKKRGMEVKVIVKSDNVLSQVLDNESARMFHNLFLKQGIDIMTGSGVQEIIGNGDCKAVKLDSGKVIASSFTVVGKGVRPNVELVRDSGIKFEQGVQTDEYLKTNIPNIYAAGDIAQTYDPILGVQTVNALWPNAVEQGLLVADNILAGNRKYPGSVGMNSVEFFGLPVISFGITNPPPEGYEELIFRDRSQSIYKKIILKDNIIKGAVFVRKVENIGVLLRLSRLRVDAAGIKDILLRPDFNFSAVKDLAYEKEEFYQ